MNRAKQGLAKDLPSKGAGHASSMQGYMERCSAPSPVAPHLHMPSLCVCAWVPPPFPLSVSGHLDQHLEVYMHELAAAVLAGRVRTWWVMCVRGRCATTQHAHHSQHQAARIT